MKEENTQKTVYVFLPPFYRFFSSDGDPVKLC